MSSRSVECGFLPTKLVQSEIANPENSEGKQFAGSSFPNKTAPATQLLRFYYVAFNTLESGFLRGFSPH